MRAKAWWKASLMAAAFCVTALPARAQQGGSQQQGSDALADAARKTREEKKNAAKPKKVYTEDDLSKGGAASATSQAAASGAVQAQKPEDASKNEDATGEKAWRKRFSNQDAKIAKAEKELDILQRESDKAQVQYYSDPQKAMTEQNTRGEIKAKQSAIEQKKKEIAQLKQERDALEDQLRKSGGDPGWAR